MRAKTWNIVLVIIIFVLLYLLVLKDIKIPTPIVIPE